MEPTSDQSSRLLSTVSPNSMPISAQDIQMDGNSGPSQPQLKFVTTTGPPSARSKAVRLVVRSHAMHAFLRGKKTEAQGDARRGPEENTTTLVDSVGRFKLQSWTRKSSKKSPTHVKKPKIQRQNGTDNGTTVTSVAKRKHTERILSPQTIYASIDPFGLLPINLTIETHRLLHHYLTTFQMNAAAVNPEGSWMAFAFTDAALLRATLALVALHTDLINGRDESSDCLIQKGEAINEINQRLGDSKRRLTDTSIATVALLTNLESFDGTRQASDVHMMALERMVRIRGGIDNFGHNKVLQRVLTWADILYSSTWDCTPRFPLVQASTATGPASTLERFSSALSRPPLPDCETYMWCISNPGMHHVLELLRRISAAMPSPDLDPADRAAISNNIYLLEHILLSSQPQSSDSVEPPSEDETMDDAPYELDLGLDSPNDLVDPKLFAAPDLSEPFRLAALLYMHLMLRELPSTARMHLQLVSALKQALAQQYPLPFLNSSSISALGSSIPQQAQATLEILAWISFTGATAAANKVERFYFIGFLRNICFRLEQVRSAQLDGSTLKTQSTFREDDLRRTLNGVAWRDGISEGYFDVLWGEMDVLYPI